MTDTIVAIATPAGIGGIAVIRISGQEAYSLSYRHCGKELQPRHATFALFKQGDTFIDEVVATYFAAPHSYTGEDTVEISCHGSLYVQQAILQTLIADGARLAEAGEFTQRAFLNGRFDLSQAEAVADLIDATNQSTHSLAISQLRGAYADRLRSLRQRFVELTSLLELELDFSEEDVEFADREQLRLLVSQLSEECRTLADTFRQGNAIKNGVPVAIIGRPNVGKSTLLNALVGDDRAIVSDIPGTTRDTIEDTLTLGGITFRFIDTAGIRHSDDVIESAGIERSIKAAQQAYVILYLVESLSAPSQIAAEIESFAAQVPLADKHLILIRNKSDIVAPSTPSSSTETAPSAIEANMQSSLKTLSTEVISLSAKQGTGLKSLRAHLLKTIQATAPLDAATPIVTNQRHHEALRQILDILPRITDGLDANLPADLVVIDIREALYHLGTITGTVATPEILHTIFSRFCIGK